MLSVRVAQRIGGFIGTTASRWTSSGLPEVSVRKLPTTNKKSSRLGRVVKPALAATGATAAVAAFAQSTALREALADVLRKQAAAVRANGRSPSRSMARQGSSNRHVSTNGHGPANGNGSTNGTGDPLSAKTRSELYEMAKKAGVSGRSKMTKTELANALKS